VTTCIVGGLAGRPRARSCHHEGDPPTHGRDPFSRPRYGIGRAIRPRALATRPCRHVRSRRTETAGSRGACGRARAVAWRASCAPRNDRSASSLAGRPCLIIGVCECRHGTGNIVRRASVEATSVVGDRARVRRFRRIRTVHISGRPAQTAAALPGACVQAASHPRIGGKSVPPPVLSERA
jgi:hypothetical protein